MWTSKEIRDLRGRMSLSQAEFAKLLGVDVRSVIRWEDPEGPQPKGSAAQILAGIREQLEREPNNADKVLKVLASAAAVGGLAYLVMKLLGAATSDRSDESNKN